MVHSQAITQAMYEMAQQEKKLTQADIKILCETLKKDAELSHQSLHKLQDLCNRLQNKELVSWDQFFRVLSDQELIRYLQLDQELQVEGEVASKEAVLTRILHFLKYKEDKLNLSSLHIKALPSCIFLFGELKELNCSHNLLTALPKETKYCRCLEKLDLSHTGIQSLPDLSSCADLSSIDLSSTPFSDTYELRILASQLGKGEATELIGYIHKKAAAPSKEKRWGV